MKIFVCVKHVPDSAAVITVKDDCRIDNRVTHIINPYDEHAITGACQIRKTCSSAEVVALCLGRDTALDGLRSAMAMGADRGILIRTDQDHDAMDTAAALKAAMDRDGGPDLVFTGKEAIDTNGGETLFRLGALYRMPAMSNVVSVVLDRNQADIICEEEKGTRTEFEVRLPCILGAAKGLNQPRYPTMPDIIKSRKKPIDILDYADLDLDPLPAATRVVRLTACEEDRNPAQLKGDADQVADQIIQVLKHQARVI